MSRMNTVLLGCLFAAGLLIAFFGGEVWMENRLLAGDRYRITQELELQVTPAQIGTLPVGTTLYKYDVSSDTTVYLAFVELKRRDVVVADTEPAGAVVKPISAYLRESKRK